MKVLLVTGPNGASHGWGNIHTTELICEALKSSGKDAEIFYVTNENDFIRGIESKSFDMVWSSLYHFSPSEDYIGACQEELWVADILEEKNIPHVGSNSRTMKNLIDKSITNRILLNNNIDVPSQHLVLPNDVIPSVTYPVFVKPCCESESTGISEESIVNSDIELKRRLHYVHETFKQPALIEDYLPGREFTVSMLGNNGNRKFYPVINIVDSSAFKKYPVIVGGLKDNGLIHLSIPKYHGEEAKVLAEGAVRYLGCLDHVRVDMREDQFGKLKVIEVNGIPGLNPIKSRSLFIYNIYNSSQGELSNFCSLINTIVESAQSRYNIK